MLTNLDEASLREAIGAVCTAPILLSARCAQDPVPELSAGEAKRYSDITSLPRRAEYLLGRSALKPVLKALGRSEDTSSIQWPSLYCSLTHSHGHAIAVGSREAHGIGVDLQIHRKPPAAMADRLLSAETLAVWRKLPECEQSTALQRFWTVNEAVYKACPAPQPAYFRHYQMTDPMALNSIVQIDGMDCRFIVHSLPLVDGYLTLALRA